MGQFSEIDIERHNVAGHVPAQSLTPEAIAWKLAQLVEDFAMATAPVSFNRAMREAYVADEHMTGALLAPVAYAAVIADACEKLGVAVPWPVRRALGDELAPVDAA